jgi:hypothetical protein
MKQRTQHSIQSKTSLETTGSITTTQSLQTYTEVGLASLGTFLVCHSRKLSGQAERMLRKSVQELASSTPEILGGTTK